MDISNNNITDEAADYIAAAISCNTQLQELDVSNNFLETTGAIIISKALKSIFTFKKLFIGNNKMSDKAADDIATAFLWNTQLLELDTSFKYN